MSATQHDQNKASQNAPLLSQWHQVRRDIWDTLSQPRLWVKLAWRDVKLQFERSRIGVFWMTLQAAAWVGAITFVFGGIMGPVEVYTVYVAIGIVLYNFITVIITDSSDVFIQNRLVIHSHPNPYFSYILKHVTYAVIQLALQSLVVIAVFLIMNYPLSSKAFLAIPGIALGVLISVNLTLIFSLLGLKIGDFRFAMSALMRLGLFITPILWSVEGGGPYKQFAALVNPMSHFINIIRMPLMGQYAPILSYYVVFASTLISAIFGIVLFARSRRAIPMWL